MIVFQVVLLSVEYRISTLSTYVLDHFIVSVFPTIKISPPFGLRTVSVGKMIVKGLLLVSATKLFVTSEILTLALMEE